jgi:Mn-dependent DtxR family transcriptional regulator
MNDSDLKKSLIGEEWMALRQIAEGTKAAAIPRSVRNRLEALGLIVRDDYGQLVLTEMGRRLIATPN